MQNMVDKKKIKKLKKTKKTCNFILHTMCPCGSRCDMYFFLSVLGFKSELIIQILL